MTFNPEITYGAILNAVVLLVGFVGAFTRIGGRIDLLAQRLQSVEKKLDTAADHDKRVSILEERATNHAQMLTITQRDISDLRRGKGFITNNRTSVDGGHS
jgi:hypothetical protein